MQTGQTKTNRHRHGPDRFWCNCSFCRHQRSWKQWSKRKPKSKK